MVEDASGNGRVTTRDVYEIVDDRTQKLDERISARFNELGAQIRDLNLLITTQITKGNEITLQYDRRMTQAEAELKNLATGRDENRGMIVQLSTNVERLRDQIRADEAAETALATARHGRQDWRRWAIGIGAFLLGSVPGFILLLH